MATIANLNINLVANTAKLTQGLQKGKGQVKGFGSNLKKLGLQIGVALAAAAAAAAAAFANLVRQQFQVIDVLAKTSRQIGISVKTLNALQFAGAKAGASNEEVSKGLTKLLKSAGDARDGLTTTKKAFEDIGLSVEDIKGLSADELFEQVSKGLSGLDDTQRRTQVSMTLMGRAGNKLIEVFDGYAEAQARLRRLGAVITDEDAAKIEAANDAWTDVQTAVKGFAQRVAVELAPTLQDLSESMVDLITGPAGDFAKKTVLEWVDGLAAIAEGATIAADAFNNMNKGAEKATGIDLGDIPLSGGGMLGAIPGLIDDIFSEPGQSLKEVEERTARINKAIQSGTVPALSSADAAALSATDSLTKLVTKLTEQQFTLGMTNEELAIYRAELAEVNPELIAQAKFLNDFVKEQKAADKAFAELTSSAERFKDAVKTPFEKLAEEFAKLKETFEAGLIDDEVFQRVKKQLEETALTAASARADAFGAAGSPGAFQRGSVAAFSKSLELDQGKQSALAEAKETNRLLGEIKDITEDEKDLVL